jgi:hypothetical protein
MFWLELQKKLISLNIELILSGQFGLEPTSRKIAKNFDLKLHENRHFLSNIITNVLSI